MGRDQMDAVPDEKTEQYGPDCYDERALNRFSK
jgi:hypothetical protein